MSVSLLTLITLVNDANLLVQAGSPLVKRLLDEGKGLDYEIPPEQLQAAEDRAALQDGAIVAAIGRAQAREAGQGELL